MYAIVELGGKQYRVATGDKIDVDHNGDGTPEARVLMLADGKKVVTDPAALAKAKVTLTVDGRVTERLDRVMKFKRRQGASSKRTIGHRNVRTRVTVAKING